MISGTGICKSCWALGDHNANCPSPEAISQRAEKRLAEALARIENKLDLILKAVEGKP